MRGEGKEKCNCPTPHPLLPQHCTSQTSKYQEGGIKNPIHLLGLYSTDNVMVGSLSVRDGGPLPPQFEEFVCNSGGHGFIIVSFGSNVASILPRKVIDMLATAFGKLKQKVVWRLKGISVIKSSNQSAASFPESVFFPPGKTVNHSVFGPNSVFVCLFVFPSFSRSVGCRL